MVVGILPPGKSSHPRFSVATLFWFVARFARVRIEDYSRNRFASTEYFAKPGTFLGGEYSGHQMITVNVISDHLCNE